jgi:hypothetical protein
MTESQWNKSTKWQRRWHLCKNAAESLVCLLALLAIGAGFTSPY